MSNLQTYLPPTGKPIREWSDSELLAKAADCFDWINRREDYGHWVAVDLQEGDKHHALLGDHTEVEDVMVAAFAAVDEMRNKDWRYEVVYEECYLRHTYWNGMKCSKPIQREAQWHDIGTSGHTHARAMLMSAVEAAILESKQNDEV